MGEIFRIEAPDAVKATALVAHLPDCARRVSPRGDGCWEIRIELDGAEQVGRLLGAVQQWLDGSELDCVAVSFDGKRYLMDSRAAERPASRTATPQS
jgi:hypothetical protein